MFEVGYGDYPRPSSQPSASPSDGPSIAPFIPPATQYPSYQPSSSPVVSNGPSIRPTHMHQTPSTPTVATTTTIKKIKLESTSSFAIHAFEVRCVFNGTNVALAGQALQSSTFNDNEAKFGAHRAVDGDESTFFSTAAGGGQWWELTLQTAVQTVNVQILNRYCQKPSDPTQCLCRLSNAKLKLYDESDNIIEVRQLGNTCGVLSISEDFTPRLSTNEPSLSPSSHTQTPVEVDPTPGPSSNKTDDAVVALYDTDLKAPICLVMGKQCSSENLLAGSGLFEGVHRELNAPNIVDDCAGDNLTLLASSVYYQQDESVEKIVIRSIDEHVIQIGREIEIDISVWPTRSTSQRPDPGKWSIAHVYYTSNVETDNITWNYVWSEVVEPSLEMHTFTTRLALESKGSLDESTPPFRLMAVRVSYSYGAYKPDPCPVNKGFTDIDDLIFVASFAPPTSAPTVSPVSGSNRRSPWRIIWGIAVLYFYVN